MSIAGDMFRGCAPAEHHAEVLFTLRGADDSFLPFAPAEQHVYRTGACLETVLQWSTMWKSSLPQRS